MLLCSNATALKKPTQVQEWTRTFFSPTPQAVARATAFFLKKEKNFFLMTEGGRRKKRNDFKHLAKW